MSAENEKLVTDFCHAWSKLNVDEILGYLAEDCFYHNIRPASLGTNSESRGK